MSLSEFENSIQSDLLRGLVRHWAEARGGRRMPGWDSIRPAAIKAQLPYVWSWKFDRATGEFVGRLAGERIQSIFGVNIRGARMADVFAGHEFDKMLQRHRRVATEPALFRGYGLVFRHLDRFDMGERVILPLAEDGENADGIIGATETRTTLGTPPDGLTLNQEIEEWFALD